MTDISFSTNSNTSNNSELELIENVYSERDFLCEHTCPELTSLCPVTGLPDYYTLKILYRPQRHLVELKSLKMFLVTYRNRGIYHEELLNEIFEIFQKKVEPKYLSMELVVNNRGGIFTSVRRQWPEGQQIEYS